jgi:hypothetical protein
MEHFKGQKAREHRVNRKEGASIIENVKKTNK